MRNFFPNGVDVVFTYLSHSARCGQVLFNRHVIYLKILFHDYISRGFFVGNGQVRHSRTDDSSTWLVTRHCGHGSDKSFIWEIFSCRNECGSIGIRWNIGFWNKSSSNLINTWLKKWKLVYKKENSLQSKGNLRDIHFLVIFFYF